MVKPLVAEIPTTTQLTLIFALMTMIFFVFNCIIVKVLCAPGYNTIGLDQLLNRATAIIEPEPYKKKAKNY